jgi:hypothetical protein
MMLGEPGPEEILSTYPFIDLVLASTLAQSCQDVMQDALEINDLEICVPSLIRKSSPTG